MSNIIPMVSSSPPPLDDAPSFSDAWGDDEDDFGNFTGADASNSFADFTNCALPSPEKEYNSIPSPDRECNSIPDKISLHEPHQDGGDVDQNKTVENALEIPLCDGQKKPSTLDLPSNCLQNGEVSGDQTDKTASSEESDKFSKRGTNGIHVKDNCENQQESEFHKRGSTTDSGMCSTDISPIPISDNMADFSDSKSTGSDTDEMFTEIQSDSHLAVVTEYNPETDNKPTSEDSTDMESPSEEQGTEGLGHSESLVAGETSDSQKLSSEERESSENFPCEMDTTTDGSTSQEVEPDEGSEFSSNNSSVRNADISVTAKGDQESNVFISNSQKNASEEENSNSDFVENRAVISDKDVNDNSDTDSDHLTFSQNKDNGVVEDLQLPQINDIDDDDSVSEVKSENENDNLNSEHSSDAQTDDFGTFREASPTIDKFGSGETGGGFAAFSSGDNEGNNWADFTGPTVAANECDDDFGDFSQTAFSQDQKQIVKDPPHLDDSDDDFGDFSTSGFKESGTSTSVQASKSESQPSGSLISGANEVLSMKGKQEKISALLLSCFPEKSEAWGNLSSFAELLDSVVEKNAPRKTASTLSLPSQRSPNVDPSKSVENVWKFLRDIEKSTASKYQWSESTGNKKLFRTLKIDARNVLMWGVKKPGLPLYAANLGLLEPTREDQKSNQGVKKLHTLVDTSKSDANVTAIPQDIPPAQFDWSGSGLTNPLDAKSSLLDLDLLAVNDGKSSGEDKPKVFQSDLLSASEKLTAQPKTLQPLETILASMKFNPTIKKVKPDENLSSEAAKIIGSLPDLSFMQAKVLMFPVKTVGEGSVMAGN